MALLGKVVSFIDIGTNSIRTMVVRLNPNYSYSILSRQKQVVRLGEDEFLEHMLIPEAMARCVLVCKRFVEMARGFGAEEFVAVATSAIREAKNQQEIISCLKEEAGIDVKVVAGKEEARLIFQGVSSAFHLEEGLGIFIDIGGGSTEISVGDRSGYVYLDSLKLGAIRLSELFIAKRDTGPVRQAKYAQMKKSVRSEVIRTVQNVKSFRTAMAAIGSSGTILNLGEVTTRYQNGGQSLENGGTLTLAKLKKTIAMLCSLDIKERREVPGINPERADIIIGGAAILETLMEELGLQEIKVSERGLLDGMLVDYLSKIDGFPTHQRMSVREASVIQLGRSCNIDEEHAKTVVRLSLEMFDTAKEEGLHQFGTKEKELLGYAAYLHDIGDFISFNNHHLHSYYIIRNAELLGFDQKEIEIMANLAKFHRKRSLSRKSTEMDELDEASQRLLLGMSSFLRIAETLDRSHGALVDHARFVNVTKEEAVLEVSAKGDCQLELWGAESQTKSFLKAYNRELRIRFRITSVLDEST
jgi:exopolyphosphatase/guanosine-5'-triphosphate,3'-diphosphate pyrophosphatase